jgi:hypothetical protein
LPKIKENLNGITRLSTINKSLKTFNKDEDNEFIIRQKLDKLKELNADFQVGLNSIFDYSQDDQFAEMMEGVATFDLLYKESYARTNRLFRKLEAAKLYPETPPTQRSACSRFSQDTIAVHTVT